MLLEAIGFAFLAAINPTALLIGAAYLGSANPTTRRTLRAFDDWLRRHKRTITVVGLAAVGVILIVNGSLGLAA